MSWMIFAIIAMGIGWLWYVCAASFRIEERKLKMKSEAKASAEDFAKLSAELAQSRTEMARVLDRIAVLERLATDGDKSLSREIENLRRSDPPRPGV